MKYVLKLPVDASKLIPSYRVGGSHSSVKFFCIIENEQKKKTEGDANLARLFHEGTRTLKCNLFKAFQWVCTNEE